jgi:hypothetical protein
VWSGDWPIPSKIRLPGVTIRVRVVPPAADRALDGGWVYEPPGDGEKALILIDGSLPLEFQRYVLLHELGHAIHETIDVMLEAFPGHVRTRFMAAEAAAKASA